MQGLPHVVLLRTTCPVEKDTELFYEYSSVELQDRHLTYWTDARIKSQLETCEYLAGPTAKRCRFRMAKSFRDGIGTDARNVRRRESSDE